MGAVRNLWTIVMMAVAVALTVILATVPAASAVEGSCPNEARRVEQGSEFLPDCRAYELVSQPYQPSPETTPFQAAEDVPVALTTEFNDFTAYAPEPRVLPQAQDHALTALDGHAVAYKGNGPNSESFLEENPVNLSRRGSDGWIGENIIPHESEHAGFGCKGTAVEGASRNLEQIAIRMGGGGEGGEDYEHCGHDEPSLASGESEETANLFLRATASSSWNLLSVYPPDTTVFDAGAAGSTEYGQYLPVFYAVSADGSHAVFSSQARLASDAPNGETIRIGGEVEGHCPNEFGNVYVWSAGADRILTVPPDGIPVRGTLAGARPAESLKGGGCEKPLRETASFTNPVGSDGERIVFYAGGGFKTEQGIYSKVPGPRAPYIDGGLYLREHPSSEQSALAHGGAAGAGTLVAGSNTVSSLRVTLAAGIGAATAGSNEISTLATLTGKFAVGQTIEGQGIPAATTISEITERTRTLNSGAIESYPVVILSNSATETVSDNKLAAVSEGPAPFAVGQTLTGKGIPAGTTITAVASGSLTLSTNATANGSHLSLEASSECTEIENACTVQIDLPEAGASGLPGGGQFQWANAEATRIFFTDEEKLTVDSTAQAGKPDLYEYDVEKPVGQRLEDITANGSEPANVLGVSGISEDGSYVYFVAQADLAGSQQNSHGAIALGPAAGRGSLVTGSSEVTGISTTSGVFQEGMAISGSGIPVHTWIKEVGPGTLSLSSAATASGVVTLSATAANLYLRHDGKNVFVASLNAEGGDQCDWTAWCLTSRVSQNGLYIAFNSLDRLTGYDNMPVKPTACNYLTTGVTKSSEASPCIEAYRYAVANGTNGELTCATCNPNGRPEAEFSWALVRQAYRAGVGPPTSGLQIVVEHPMANSGQFFFETEEKLVVADENGDSHASVDVYEYSGGEGANAQYHLISTGKSNSASEFIDASVDGSNVFFTTSESLLHADTRSGSDIYDARVNGGLISQSAAAQTPPCTSTEACRSPLDEPPAEFAAGSAALFGAGDLIPTPEKSKAKKIAVKKSSKCVKGLVRRHGRCVKTRRKQSHSKSRVKASHRRVVRRQRSAGK